MLKKMKHFRNYSRYGELYRIKNIFRLMKSQLEHKPKFHWKPRRIKAHFCFSFVTFALSRILHFGYHLKYRHKPISQLELLEVGLNGTSSVVYRFIVNLLLILKYAFHIPSVHRYPELILIQNQACSDLLIDGWQINFYLADLNKI